MVHRLLLGAHYRDLWTTPLRVAVLDIGTYAGGLTPSLSGGRRETKSLRLVGPGGREYVFRSVDKDPTLALPPDLRATFVRDLIQDQISSAHPGAPLVVAPLLDAAHILNAEPHIYVFLQHARIYHFANGGRPESYIGSADWRPRNLRQRAEVVTPVEDPASRARLDGILDSQLADPTAWDLGPDGSYQRRTPASGTDQRTSQERLLAQAGATLGLIILLAGARLTAQVCREPHYRWTQKVDTTAVAVLPQQASVAAILGTWAPPLLASRDDCAPRGDRERQTYSLVAWVRRVDKVKDDDDWHLELTDRADSPADSCIVAEIPHPRYSRRYAVARSALDSLIAGRRLRKGGILRRPVKARVTGLAFFDGQHRRGGRRSDRMDGGHGHCNTSVRALWEIHPVYRVDSP